MKPGSDDARGSPQKQSTESNFLPESLPIIYFDRVHPDAQSKFSGVDLAVLPPFNGSPIAEQAKSILDDFAAHDFPQVCVHPSKLLCDLRLYASAILKKEDVETLNSTWPPEIPRSSAQVSALLLFLIKLTTMSSTPLNLLNFIAAYLIGNIPFGSNSQNSAPLIACCLCHRKRKIFSEPRFFWAQLDRNFKFTLYRYEDTLIEHFSSPCAYVRLSRSGHTVKIFGSEGQLLKRFVPVDPAQLSLWASIDTKLPSLAEFFTSIMKPLPNQALISLYYLLQSDDLLVVRALCHFSVVKVSEGVPLAEALLEIFSHFGKVSQLLVMLASSEFSSANLTPNTVLRSNSHLTNFCKVFYDKFGRRYYDNFLKKLIQYIDKCGDLKLKTPSEADISKVQTVLFTSLNEVIGSAKWIPSQMRHLASILKVASALRFNSKQAAYNTLSGFFCLRFVAPIISNPLNYDPNGITLSNQGVMLPFTQLFQGPFKLKPFGEKFEAFSPMNAALEQKMFPMIINFVFSIADLAEPAVYEAPSEQKLVECLNFVMNEITSTGAKFVDKYRELRDQGDAASTMGWNSASLLASNFVQNLQN